MRPHHAERTNVAAAPIESKGAVSQGVITSAKADQGRVRAKEEVRGGDPEYVTFPRRGHLRGEQEEDQDEEAEHARRVSDGGFVLRFVSKRSRTVFFFQWCV